MKIYLLRFFIVILIAFFSAGNSHAVTDSVGGPATARAGGGEKKVRYKEGELLVKFIPSAAPESKNTLHRKHGSVKIKEFPSLRIHRIKLRKGLAVEDAIALYSADPNVEYAEPNFIVKAFALPDDPRFDELWGLNNAGQTGGTPDGDIDALQAWDVTTGSSNVVVAVIDTGVDYNHVDLSGNIWTNPGEIPGNGIDDDANGYIDDVHGIDIFTTRLTTTGMARMFPGL